MKGALPKLGLFIGGPGFAACKFEDTTPRFRADLIAMAIGNLSTENATAAQGHSASN